MEKEQKENNSKVVLAVVLIVVGIVWLLKKVGIYFEFPRIFFENIFYPFRQVFHWLTHFIFSWPMILIIIGIILMAGRRSAGLVLVVVGGIFLLPKIFFLPGLTISFLLPVLLIGFGVALVARVL